MITFTKAGNSVQLTSANGDVYYISSETLIHTRINEGRIYIQNNTLNDSSFFKYYPTDINGRPNDDLEDVAEWLRDTYFTGLDITGGGSWPGDYATSGNQTTIITELNNIETDIESLVDKTPTDLVTELHDYKEIVYTGSNIDYISYKTGGSGGTEVARVTFTYDVDDNITEITKT